MWAELKKGQTTLFPKCKVAVSFGSRLMGLMGRKSLSPDEAILFPRCSSIHTFFMRMKIDVVFVSKNGEVVQILNSLKPWRFVMPVKGAAHTLEMSCGAAKDKAIVKGDRLECPGVIG